LLWRTGVFEPCEQERATRVGCDGFLAKPFEPQTLIAKVKELLNQAGSRPAPSRPAATAPAYSPPPPPAYSPPAPPPYSPPAPPAYSPPAPAASSPAPTPPAPSSAAFMSA